LDAPFCTEADACEPPTVDLPPLPDPVDVPAGSSCEDDEDCELLGGFCRALQAGGAECVSYHTVDESCGGLVAPWDEERCMPGLVCDATGDSPGVCTCTPQCSGRVCGSDGCGGSCGACEGTCFNSGKQCAPFAGDLCCNP